jgi:hypothetical protein
MQWVKGKGFAARLLGIGQSGRSWLKKRGAVEQLMHMMAQELSWFKLKSSHEVFDEAETPRVFLNISGSIDVLKAIARCMLWRR